VAFDDLVADGEPLLRRVLATQLEWHADFRRYIPALSALSFDPDGLSVSRENLLTNAGVDASALIGGKPALVYRSHPVSWRSRGCDVVPDPNTDTPYGFAHALVTLPAGQSRLGRRERNEIAATMELAAGTAPPPPPD
jgi:hypothetical protein